MTTLEGGIPLSVAIRMLFAKEKFTKCSAGQIVKYKLNNKKKRTSCLVHNWLNILLGFYQPLFVRRLRDKKLR